MFTVVFQNPEHCDMVGAQQIYLVNDYAFINGMSSLSH
jgi:hypothetical protein